MTDTYVEPGLGRRGVGSRGVFCFRGFGPFVLRVAGFGPPRVPWVAGPGPPGSSGLSDNDNCGGVRGPRREAHRRRLVSEEVKAHTMLKGPHDTPSQREVGACPWVSGMGANVGKYIQRSKIWG